MKLPEACIEILIVVCTLLLGDAVIWFNGRRKR
jgi:hypothetical protein